MRATTLFVMIAACGSNERVDQRVDAAASGQSDASVRLDAGITMTACKQYRRIVTQSNGTRTESTNFFVEIPGVKPGDGVIAILCDQVPVATTAVPCPTGATCQEVGTYPTGRYCQVLSPSTFLNDTAVVPCGFENVYFDAGGVETARSGSHFTSVEIRR